jgi:hypothetical protein
MKKIILTIAIISTLFVAGCTDETQWVRVPTESSSMDQQLVFRGDAALSGWGVQVPFYAGDPELHFHVAPESLSQLPQDFDFAQYDYNFKLENANKEFIQIVARSTTASKSEVLVDRIIIPQEGHPLLHLMETPGNSTSPQSQ